MCADGEFHCQNEFRANYIFSPHKRRCEIEGRRNQREPITGKFYFRERKCEHGVGGQKDYLMVENPDYVPPRELTSEQILIEAMR